MNVLNEARVLAPPETSSRRRAFTLIELLIVITIIGILAAILFPVFARVRENARRTSCLSNLHQIGLGLLQYTQDYDEHNALQWVGSSGASNATTSYKWMDAIFPYVKSEQLFNCPSHSLPAQVGIRTYDKYKFRSGRNWGSYAANVAYYPVSAGLYYNPFQSRNVATWETPSTTVYAADGAGRFEFAWEYPTEGNPAISPGPPRYFPGEHGMIERHLGTCVALFCDGHAKAQKLEKFTVVGTQGLYSAFTVQADPD